MLDEFNVDRNRVIIEITESKGDLDKLVEIADLYRQHGLKIAIDDFGAGFSQLERVMAIQPDIIKLDMQLFQNAAKGGIASDVVHLISRLAKRTGCRIVCEGVETIDDFHFGLSCGAQYMQGYLFSPATAEFKEPLHYQKQISSLRKTFLKKTLAKEEHKIQFIANIKGLIECLKIALETDFNLKKLSRTRLKRAAFYGSIYAITKATRSHRILILPMATGSRTRLKSALTGHGDLIFINCWRLSRQKTVTAW